MKKLAPAFLLVIVVIGFVAYLLVSFASKGKYDKVRLELANHVLSETPMDEEREALLNELGTNGTVVSSALNGPYTDALKTLGWEPSVESVVELMTYRMPEYSWMALGGNQRPMNVGAVQAVVLSSSVDKQIHVSDDRQVALIQISPAIVYVFQNEQGGIRETQYQLKQTGN